MSTTVDKRATAKAKAPKAPTAKKPKDLKEKKPKSAPKASSPSHPPYFQMIKEAILALHERTGSSPYAIAKHMEEKHKGTLPANFRKLLAVQLRNLAANGKLSKVKASFKLSEPGKQAEKKAVKSVKPKVASKVKKPKASAKAEKKVPKTVNKPAPAEKSVKKKPVAKKVKLSAPAKRKQPKSIKSPAAKRARKAVA